MEEELEIIKRHNINKYSEKGEEINVSKVTQYYFYHCMVRETEREREREREREKEREGERERYMNNI